MLEKITQKNPMIIGWDIGGAHLKAALLNANGQVQNVVQVPCALWRGLNVLEVAIEEIFTQFSINIHQPNEVLHAVTMTGELVDLFENRQQGVLEISRVMHEKCGDNVYFFQANTSRNPHFVTFLEVKNTWQTIASVNWFASACVIAQKIPTGMLIDMGSTTTDFVVLHQGQPACVGLTDAARLQSQELVYTGVVRTPLMALTPQVAFKNTLTNVAAEYFATTADIYRLLEELPTHADMAESADGQDKTARATARRIARMIGHDVEDAPMQDWLQLAQNFKQSQLKKLCEVTKVHIHRLVDMAAIQNPIRQNSIKLIGVGAGQFLLKQLVVELNAMLKITQSLKDIVIEYEDFNAQMAVAQHLTVLEANTAKSWTSVCFPAVAVAILANQHQPLIKPVKI